MEGCRLRVDQPLNFLEKLFCATCGVQVDVVPVDVDAAEAEVVHAREARSRKLSTKILSAR